MMMGLIDGVAAATNATFTATFNDGQNIAFGSSTYTTATITIGTGLFVFFLFDGAARTHSGVTIGGTSATLVLESTDHTVSMWYANTSVATGTISVTGSAAFGVVLSCGGLFTGVSATPKASAIHQPNSVADPQTVALTVPTGSIGFVAIGAGITVGNPTTWANVTRDAICEAVVATGNTGSVSGAHVSGAGASITASATGGGGGNGWGFANAGMIFACWGP